jgi:hypothetical protein
MGSLAGKYLCLFFLLIIAFHAEANPDRVKYNFNPQWKLHVGNIQGAEKPDFDDSGWKEVTLPYAWNQEEAFKNSIHDLTTGIAWYRKQFKLPISDQGKKVFIEFEGVRQGAEFYVNGEKVGIHENGVMAVGFDIGGLLFFGEKENCIAVRTDNDWKYKEKESGVPFQWSNDNFNANYGGIPKNVCLHVSNKVYQTLPLYSNLKTTGVYIYATHIDVPKKAIRLNAESQVKNESGKQKKVKLQVELIDLDGNTASTFEGKEISLENGQMHLLHVSQNVKNIEFWSWGYGYLYTVKTRLLIDGKSVDEVITRTGFRKTAFNDGMFYLNDRVLQLKGYAQRTSNEWPAIGMSCPPWMSDFSNKMMVESNGNLVRWMHTTPWKQDVESCDRVGLIQAMPAGDAEDDAKGRQWEQRVELMRDAIIYNRNNPSIIFYEGGNESISEEHMAELKAIRDQYDPYGGRAIGSREMLDSKIAEYGGEMLYINKSAHIPMWAMEYSRDEGLRKYWDNYSFPYHRDGEGSKYYRSTVTNQIVQRTDASVYNRNQDSHAIENIMRWFDYWEMRPGTGKRVSSGGVNIVFSDSNTHYRGAENYRRSGEVDAMRIPKDNYGVHQVMWDGWVDTERHNTHILGHWNYDPTVVKSIHVASNGDKVELFVNGKSKGFGIQKHRFLFVYENIQWEAGSIKAVSYNKSGDRISSDSINTAGEPASIRLTLRTHPEGMKADGADLALIDVEVVDPKGQRCPLANNLIHFDLNGEASWLGGIAQGPENYILSKTLPVECGINRVMVRSTVKAGKIELKAVASGLPTANLSWESKPFETENGLSRKMPYYGLPVNLERGPTPLTPSYRLTRIPVAIESARAEINSETAHYSYDDNELTEWRNDGKLSTGSISYQLERPAILNECVIKLTGWRMRKCPLQILVDGAEVYRDTTGLSLGYVTLPLKPAKGQEVTIRLIGANSESDAFNQITELDAKKELDLFHDPKASKSEGQLRIVEVEFYEGL